MSLKRWAAKADVNQPEIVAALRKAGATVWHIGWPMDLLVGFNDRTLVLEVKRDAKARHTDDQLTFLRTWTGGPVATAHDADGALRAARLGNWRDMGSAPTDRHILGVVDGVVRVIRWGKTSHVPLYGYCLADQGPEDFDLCEPTYWMPMPEPPES